MRLALFDVDGTLLTTAHAGMRAFCRAMQSTFGIDTDGEIIHPDGKTDPLIAREMLAYFGMEHRLCDGSREALFSSYLSCLEEEMRKADGCGAVRILPGVEEFLELLSRQPDFAMGLVTGNLQEGARIKLEKAGLFHYFQFGGFGSDSEDRTDLTRTGIRRGKEMVAPAPVEAAFVIGDTPLDIVHGRAAGAFVIAVAGGRYTLPELEAAKPDLAVPDLGQAERILSFMRARCWADKLIY